MKRVTLFLFITLLTTILSGGNISDGYILPTVDGKKIHVKNTENGLDFKEFEGRVVFLEFWGTRCPPCRMSIPNYIKLKNKFKDKLAIVAIEVQDTPKEALKSFVKAKGINYNVVAYRDAYDFVSDIAKRAQWRGAIPFLIILDKAGNVVTMQLGLLNEEALSGVVEKLSKAKVNPPAKKK